MVVLLAIVVLSLGWWLMHLLELGYSRKDGSFFFAALLVGLAIAGFFIFHQILLQLFAALNHH